MTATGHAIIGTVIAAKIGNPQLAVPLAIASHIAADAFPHWDEGTNSKEKSKERFIAESAFDVILSFALSYLLIFALFPTTNLLYAFLIIIASQSLDWLTAPYLFFGLNIPPFNWFYKFQKNIENKLDKPWGIINQIVILVLIVIAAKIF